MKRFLAYYRVSTKRQGQSGLGLEAQQASVQAYANTTGGTVLRAYQEIESGGKDDRPELLRMVADAKRSKATIVIARLDRLARDAHLISGLQKTGVPFVCCDMPEADETMIGIYGYLGQREKQLISARTKAALAQAKARGVKLGTVANLNQDGRDKGVRVAAKVNRRKADEAYSDLAPWLREMRATKTLKEIADALNSDGHTTRRGKPWNPMQVKRVIERG